MSAKKSSSNNLTFEEGRVNLISFIAFFKEKNPNLDEFWIKQELFNFFAEEMTTKEEKDFWSKNRSLGEKMTKIKNIFVKILIDSTYDEIMNKHKKDLNNIEKKFKELLERTTLEELYEIILCRLFEFFKFSYSHKSKSYYITRENEKIDISKELRNFIDFIELTSKTNKQFIAEYLDFHMEIKEIAHRKIRALINKNKGAEQ